MKQILGAKNFTVLSPIEFLEDIEKESSNATDRVWAQAMEIEGGELTDRLFNILKKSAGKQLDARLHADHYSLMMIDGVFNYVPGITTKQRQIRKKRFHNKLGLFKDLIHHGVQVKFTNVPNIVNRILPTRGRNHMKMVIIDDLAWIGGVNFHDENFKAIDIMIKLTLKDIVDTITKLYEKIDDDRLLHNFMHTSDNNNKLLVDAGISSVSIILETAVSMINHAEKSVKATSAFVPDGRFLKALYKAEKRGVEIQIITNNPAVLSGVYNMVNIGSQIEALVKRQNIPITYLDTLIHAKTLVVDEMLTLVGSHNFSSKGVTMRTGEVALLSRDKALVKNILSFIETIS